MDIVLGRRAVAAPRRSTGAGVSIREKLQGGDGGKRAGGDLFASRSLALYSTRARSTLLVECCVSVSSHSNCTSTGDRKVGAKAGGYTSR